MMQQRTVWIVIPVVAVFFFLIGWQAGHAGLETATVKEHAGLQSFVGANIARDRADLSLFWDVWDRLSAQYVDPTAINTDKMVYGAIKGMVSALDDPYSVFMDPQESKEFKNNLTGKLDGIGAQLSVKEKNLTVMSVLKDSPAEKSGLKGTDIILKIDDAVAGDMTIYEAITKIRGARGTSVKLLIYRKNNGDPFELTIVRDEIRLNSIELTEKPNNISVIALHQFTDSTMTELTEVIPKILAKKPKGIILDLRDNGGGYLEVAVDVLSELLIGKKEVVTIRKRDPKYDEKKFTSGSGRMTTIPLVVLVNNGSASASEIVAGAVQDYKRGTVIGEKTYGKGSVQEIDERLKNNASLRMTIAKWLTPLGRSINKVGIEPDQTVKYTEADLKKGVDPQMDAALKALK